MVVELAGLPRSGKTSAIEIIRDYFGRSGRIVRTIAEGARSCPFDKKHRIELSSWTANLALNNVLESHLSSAVSTLVLQDRGLFDSIVFLKLLHLENLIDKPTFLDFASYFTNTRWTLKVDLVVLLDVEPEMAVERDLASKLTNHPGLITNLQSLGLLRNAYNYVLENYKSSFTSIKVINTSQMDRLEVANQIISLIKEY